MMKSDRNHYFTTKVKKKLSLRASIFQMQAMILRGEGDQVEGACAPIVADVLHYIPESNVTPVWSDDGTLFGIKRNGTYTGVLGQFAANASDVLLLPLPITPEADVAVMGPALSSSSSKMISLMIVSSFPNGIMKQLFRYSADTVILAIAAVLCFAFMFQKSENKVSRIRVSLFRSMWHMICLMILRPQRPQRHSSS